jgi:hypothetical protein
MDMCGPQADANGAAAAEAPVAAANAAPAAVGK